MQPSTPSPSPNTTELLLPVVYDELRRLAGRSMAGEKPQTIGATALVHEAYLRLKESDEEGNGRWQNPRHFFGAAAEAMRRILIDRARARAAKKRGGDLVRDEDSITQIVAPVPDDEIIAVGEALERFAEVDGECAELVKLKYFIGLTWEEIAEITGESTRTLRRRWAYARSWLYAEIQHELRGE